MQNKGLMTYQKSHSWPNDQGVKNILYKLLLARKENLPSEKARIMMNGSFIRFYRIFR